MNRFALLLPLALAACNNGPTVTAKNASVEEVSNKVAAAQGSGSFISPGHWDGKVTITKMEAPGMEQMPAETRKAMLDKMAAGQSFSSCVTEADVKSPKAGMFGGDKSCRYDHFTMAGGSIDAKLSCESAGQKREMTIKGTYSADSYHTEVTSDGGAAGSMAASVDAKRAGECTGKENS
ncbi:DUF3617 domain-containing protein [Sphingomonas sp. HITSZ_GF]|uniref:DUF3617 domain-containing protein n=1 Tax=Sphingomonas sp. HITSZ_GF TaxID=3037247 RepID=UPI00240E080F|nr:DUF3617 domain-containing protein [Sphingomonas sp. HITSZ_GF]MDG2535378.1 DUF3617 domain-containing protein [Sphingomonas sp. HITSZ_GF]